jgi:DNA replication protein DnaC
VQDLRVDCAEKAPGEARSGGQRGRRVGTSVSAGNAPAGPIALWTACMNAQMSLTPTNPPAHTSSPPLESLKQRLRRLNLYGLLTHAEELIGEPWLARVLEIEESELQCRSLKRRTDNARVGKFKSLADFDHHWPKQLDKTLLEELFTFDFLEQGVDLIIVGPNGLGKTMIAKNLLHQAILRGHTARFTVASDMLHDLAAQDSSTQLARRLRRYTTQSLICIDEVGYLS